MERINAASNGTVVHRPMMTSNREKLELSAAVRDYCEGLLCRLLWSEGASSQAVQAIGITSCQSGEGVSTVAAQLAVAAATSGGLRVLLVDANDQRPSVHQTFGVPAEPGWSDVLRDPSKASLAIQPSGAERLSLLTAGDRNNRMWPTENTDLPDVLKTFKADFPLIIFDLPAVGQTSAALRLAGLLDGILLVVEAERVRYEVARRVRETLARSNARLFGAVLNKRRQYVPNWLYRTL